MIVSLGMRVERITSERLFGCWTGVRMGAGLIPDGDFARVASFTKSPGIAWNRRYGASPDVEFARLRWADIAVALIGQSVPPRAAALSLNARLILYCSLCLLVESCTQDETRQIMGRTEGETDRSLRDGPRVVGGSA